MAVGHGRDHGLFVLKIAIDQTDTDPGLGTDIVHAGLVKPALGKACYRGIQDLSWPV
jgi:hypothetical protein